MSVFICWSGPRGRQLADATRSLLEAALRQDSPRPKAAPGAPGAPAVTFLSQDIEKGSSWFARIIEQLQYASAGVVCLTPESVASPWLHFEAGALACRLHRSHQTDGARPGALAAADQRAEHRLFTVLHGVTPAELSSPLSAYQATTTTRADMAELIRALSSTIHLQDGTETSKTSTEVGGDGHSWVAGSDQPLSDQQWRTFEQALDGIAVPVRELVQDFEAMFQRKSFYEPVHHCADQAWLGRHAGVRSTYERLALRRAQIASAAPRYEREVFEMLLSELDGYAMALHSLLLQPKRFALQANGELDIDDGTRNCCEERRLAIRSLTSRLLRPLDTPATREAVRFMGAETHEERKMIVHRLEAEVRREWEAASREASEDWRERAVLRLTRAEQPVAADAVAPIPPRDPRNSHPLTAPRDPLDLRESSWDLDRIYYYLLVRYFDHAVDPTNSPVSDVVCAARDVEMEVERFEARAKGGSAIPLIYALIAVHRLVRYGATDTEMNRTIESALQRVARSLQHTAIGPEARADVVELSGRIRQAIGSELGDTARTASAVP